MALVEAVRANMDLLNLEWTIRQLELIKKRIRLGSLTPVTLAIVVYLQRSPRPHAHLKSLFADKIIKERRVKTATSALAAAAPGPAWTLQMSAPQTTTKTTYTRMARRQLSPACLKDRGIDYELDTVSHQPSASVSPLIIPQSDPIVPW